MTDVPARHHLPFRAGSRLWPARGRGGRVRPDISLQIGANTRMRRSGFIAAVAATAALATALTGGPAGAATTRPHFTRLTGVTMAPGFTPLALDKGPVTVSVTLTTPSVTRRELRLGRTLKQSERRAVRREVRRSQSGVRRLVASHHGRVIREMADAVNAL